MASLYIWRLLQIFRFTRKLAIAASLVALYSVQFVALASDDEPMELDFPSAQRLALTNTVDSVELPSEDVEKKNFFLFLPFKDVILHLVGVMCEESSPFRLAQVCKAWYRFVMGRDITVNKNQPIVVDPFFKSCPIVQDSMMKWRAQRDLQILEAGTFRYQLEGSNAIEVKLSMMAETNGDLVLPDKLVHRLCVTRRIETFVNPVGKNTRKTLVLLMTLSELKSANLQIFKDTSFIRNVGLADLSQNAVCAIIRYGGDELAKSGFRYTILKVREMNNSTLWQIYTHKKARGGSRAALWDGPLRWAPRGGGCFRFLIPN